MNNTHRKLGSVGLVAAGLAILAFIQATDRAGFFFGSPLFAAMVGAAYRIWPRGTSSGS
jgi:hypothetical protein